MFSIKDKSKIFVVCEIVKVTSRQILGPVDKPM